ncbi:MAG: polysaccharide pyruvyl transferase family protein [Clostridia bacterium]
MKKIGLVSVSIHNYGSLLQTYAMQKVLDDLKLENDIILFKSDPVKQIYRIFNISFMTMKLKLLKRKLITNFFYKDIFEGSVKRDFEFQKFKNQYCRFTQKTTSRDKLLEYGNQYDAFVLGSDQVWNPANLEMNFYTLNFVPLKKPKIAYAPSFGVSTIPEKQIDETKEYLNRIQHISVRETAGANIVENLTNRKVPVVCDPTALLSVEQWNELRSDKKYTDGKYIFCYFLGGNTEHRKLVKKIQEKTGFKIIALQHIDEFVKSDINFPDISAYDVGPQDFLNLIADAEYVFTDSFHCTMFSIYYHKKFFTLSRYSESKKDSTNSRIISILELMGLKSRNINSIDTLNEQFNINIDWIDVQDKLEKFRETSFEYLVKALKNENLL